MGADAAQQAQQAQQELLESCLDLVFNTYDEGLAEQVTDPVIFLLDCEDEIGEQIASGWLGSELVRDTVAEQQRQDDSGEMTTAYARRADGGVPSRGSRGVSLSRAGAAIRVAGGRFSGDRSDCGRSLDIHRAYECPRIRAVTTVPVAGKTQTGGCGGAGQNTTVNWGGSGSTVRPAGGGLIEADRLPQGRDCTALSNLLCSQAPLLSIIYERPSSSWPPSQGFFRHERLFADADAEAAVTAKATIRRAPDDAGAGAGDLVFAKALQQALGQASIDFQPGSKQLQQRRALRGGKRGSRSLASPPAETKQEEKQPAGKEDKQEEEAEKKQEEVKTIKRPTDGSGKLDPNRVRLQPDANGLVQFNYSGHPWAEVLQEFADAAKFSFDWQELPADNLNLVTQKKYNLLQARDLLNRHLLAHGFTLVVQGEVLTAVKISNLDPSLVPRVEADELEDYSPHDFVRVRFALPQSMEPAKAKDDVQVLLSPNAKVTPLLNSKRLLVIDTVANLRGVRRPALCGADGCRLRDQASGLSHPSSAGRLRCGSGDDRGWSRSQRTHVPAGIATGNPADAAVPANAGEGQGCF